MDNNMYNLANAIDKATQLSTNAPTSMQITKIPEIQSKTVREQTFLEYLEINNRTRDISTNNVVFFEETGGSDAEFIPEVGIPAYTAKQFTEHPDHTRTIAIPIEVSMKAQDGNDTINLKENLITDGYIKVNNLIDQALLAGDATTNPLEFDKIWKSVDSDSMGASITEAKVKEAIRTCIDNGGTPDCIVTDSVVADQLDALVSPFIRYNNVTEIALGHTVSTFKSTDGSFIPILVDKNVPADSDEHRLAVIDSSTIDIAYQRRPSYIELAQTDLATRSAIYAWVTAYNTAPFKSFVIDGITE